MTTAPGIRQTIKRTKTGNELRLGEYLKEGYPQIPDGPQKTQLEQKLNTLSDITQPSTQQAQLPKPEGWRMYGGLILDSEGKLYC